MVDGSPAQLETRSALCWDDQALYIAFWMAEPDLRAALTRRDDPVYQDNDVEVFIAGQDVYYELEVNALGTVYEVFWIWDDARGRDAIMAGLKPSGRRTLRLEGIGPHVHPRGWRTGFLDWDLPGLRTAVAVQGTVNDSTDSDTGWSVEMAVPWSGLTAVADPHSGRPLPPEPGGEWRVDLSRFQWFRADGSRRPQPRGWAWSVHGAFDSHMPERFGKVVFTD